jgi:hypothetical protein
MKTLLELEDGDCRYPFGESAPYLFCGDPAQDKSSYCSACHAIAWVKPISALAKARVYHGTDFAA